MDMSFYMLLSEVARSVSSPLRMQVVLRLTLVFSTFFDGDFPSSADSRRASCQLLWKEWPLNTG